MVLASVGDPFMFTADSSAETASLSVSGEGQRTWLFTHCENPGLVKAIDEKLGALLKLKHNWDGYGAPVINRRIVSASRSFIHSVAEKITFPTPYVTPGASGNLQFEWHRGSKSLELEVEDPNTIHYLKWRPEQKVEEENVFDIRDSEKAIPLIKWFQDEVLRV